MNRAQRRAAKKNKNNKEVEEKISLFSKLPDECLACLKPFNKKDKKMVLSWNVVVRNDSETVRLYCPDCWQKAKNVVEAYNNENSGD